MRKLFRERKLFKGGNYMRKYGNSLLLYTILGSQYQCEVCIPTMSTPSMTICSLEQGIVKANIEL